MKFIKLHEVKLNISHRVSGVLESNLIWINPDYILKFWEFNQAFSDDNETQELLENIKPPKVGSFPTKIMLANGNILTVAECTDYIFSCCMGD